MAAGGSSSAAPMIISGPAMDFKASSTQTADDKKTVFKVWLLGDSEVGKTSLMVKYVDNIFDQSYVETLGVAFMNKTVVVRGNKIEFAIWDLGGQKGFLNMLPLVCREARAILFCFDLTKKSSLLSMKEWYQKAREVNKSAAAFLIGTKFDAFTSQPPEYIEEVSTLARRYAAAMKASLIFCSSSKGINIQNIFRVVLAKATKKICTVAQISEIGHPILEYTNPAPKAVAAKAPSEGAAASS